MSTASEWALWTGLALAAIGAAFAAATVLAVERRKQRRARHAALQQALVEAVFGLGEVPASLRQRLSPRSQLLAWLQVHERLAGDLAADCRRVAAELGLDRAVATLLSGSARRDRIVAALAAGRMRLDAHRGRLRALSEQGDTLEVFAAIDALQLIDGQDALGEHLLRLLSDSRRTLAEVRDVAMLYDSARLEAALAAAALASRDSPDRRLHDGLTRLQAITDARAAESIAAAESPEPR